MKLKEIAKTIRSKNAGVDHITFEIIFGEKAVYERVKRAGAITAETIAGLYQIKKDRIVRFICFDPANAIKFTIIRERPSGGIGETDVFGCQQYPPLFDLEIVPVLEKGEMIRAGGK